MSKRYKAVCPSCKSNNVVAIAYGFPGDEMMEDSIKGKIRLCGCVIEERAEEILSKWRKNWTNPAK